DGEVVFCSNATDLLPGAPQPSNSGLYQAGDLDGDGIHDIITRIDKLPGGGFGSDNHEPAISPDGLFAGFTSKTNYSTGGVLANYDAWLSQNESSVLITDVSLNAAGQP